MWENFFHAVCRVGVFVICAQAILCFRPRQSHEKYLKLLVSVMILVQIFQPVARILGAEGSGEIQERIAWFQEQLDQEMARSAGEGMVSQELLDRMTLSQVRERLEEASQNGPLEGRSRAWDR